MKTKYSIILFIIICLGCSQTKHILSINKNRENDVMYKIKETYNHELFDIIYAQRNDSLFKIISLRDTIMPKLKPLEVGKKYQLDLIRIYPDYNNEKTKIGVKDSCLMGIEKKSHFSLYSATNLNGLFLSETSKDITELVNKFSVYAILGDAVQRNKNASLTVLYLK
ncbi:MAG: hypothetical protein FWD60_13540 [Candidatus Azobacteroides sp.]|nr:hypothetical protein [Candidatus Azobacteroides sp.]